jgi:hypothetical protein
MLLPAATSATVRFLFERVVSAAQQLGRPGIGVLSRPRLRGSVHDLPDERKDNGQEQPGPDATRQK